MFRLLSPHLLHFDQLGLRACCAFGRKILVLLLLKRVKRTTHEYTASACRKLQQACKCVVLLMQMNYNSACLQCCGGHAHG